MSDYARCLCESYEHCDFCCGCTTHELTDRQRERLERKVTVCDHCLMASCWQGIHMCQQSAGAGTTTLPVGRLLALNVEHPDYWDLDAEATS